MTLLGVDPIALEYAASELCSLRAASRSGHSLSWQFEAADAAVYLGSHAPVGLVLSNPPHVPIPAECTGGGSVGSMWVQ